MDNQPLPPRQYQPPVTQSLRPPAKPTSAKAARNLLFGIIALVIAIASGSALYIWQSKQSNGSQARTSGSPGSSPFALQVYQGEQQKARNTKRQVDMQSLQTQLEAFFSQQGYYPSLTDMNSDNWRNANMSTLDPNALIDPSNPSSSNRLVLTPIPQSYAYKPTNSNGGSCEANDTACAKYTLTATFEGTDNGQPTYTKTNLD